MNYVSLLGVLLIRVAHGFRRSGLFSSVNVYYRFIGGRKLIFSPAFIKVLPLFRFLLFLLCCSNSSVPPSLGLFGEINIFSRLIRISKILIIFIVIYVFRVGLYNMYLYLALSHGVSFVGIKGKVKKYTLMVKLFFHLPPVVGLFFLNFIMFLCSLANKILSFQDRELIFNIEKRD
jgi:NADH:ubiquinone oxidoreductase subunit 4 (subunit M)